MKKATIIFSFLLITVFSVDNYLLHLSYLKNYKRDFREYLIKGKNESALSYIEIEDSELYVNSDSISWEDNNQELVYCDKLYDIIALKHKGNKVILTVVSDDDEMELKKKFASIYDINSHRGTKNPFKLLKFSLTLKCIVTDNKIEFIGIRSAKVSFASLPAFQLPNRSISKETPPPDFFI